MGIWYATREQVKAAANSALDDAAIDRLLESHSRAAEVSLGSPAQDRRFYPLLKTTTYKDTKSIYGQKLWPTEDIISLVEVTLDGVEIADAEPGPANNALPYEFIDLGSTVTPSADNVLSVSAVWGYSDDEAAAGALDGSINNDDASCDVTDSSLIGVGDLIHIDDERMAVSGKTLTDTTATLSADLDALDSATLVAVDDVTKLHQGEVITVGAERMLIESITDSLIVRRAYDGSTLASHDMNDAVYAPRTLTLERGAAGTEAASHDTDVAITRNVPPGLINEWIIAEVISAREQEKSGYARNIGQGDGVMELRSVGLQQLRDRVIREYGRVEVTF